jgi:cyclophilin family peptidyl-prolyl cis-trans isomerase
MEKTHFLKLIYLISTILLTFSCTKRAEDVVNVEKTPINVVNANTLKVDADGLSTSLSIIKTVHGNIVFKYYPKQAPSTVTRVIGLIKSGFYDGLIFHRVIPDFVVQTGDPTNTGRGGSGQKLKAEFSKLQHIKGTVAMARSRSDIDSADSQFYISLATLPHLDEKYTVFGQVVEGLEILDKIKKDDKIISVEYIE